jgi:S-adenosylmethionine decarboxylase
LQVVSDERIELQGFNNLTKVVSFNLYDFFVARTDEEREAYVKQIDETYSAQRITKTLAGIAEIIDAEVLSVSAQDYQPHGASSLVLMSDLGQEPPPVGPQGHKSVGAHLTKSHLCAHTYPDWVDPGGICSFRVDIDVATCGTIVPLRALDFMFESFETDVVIIDYVVRGFTRDTRGRRVYIDHSVDSIQDFISPEILSRYVCEDVAMAQSNTWQTKMRLRDAAVADHFPPGSDPTSPENLEALEMVKAEMAAIFGAR